MTLGAESKIAKFACTGALRTRTMTLAGVFSLVILREGMVVNVGSSSNMSKGCEPSYGSNVMEMGGGNAYWNMTLHGVLIHITGGSGGG